MNSPKAGNRNSSSKLTRETEIFKHAYIALLDKTKGKVIEYKKDYETYDYYGIHDKCASAGYELIGYLIRIYEYVIKVNDMHFLFDRPAQTDEPHTTDEMVSFFSRMREIQSKIPEVMKESPLIENTHDEFVEKFIGTPDDIDRYFANLFEVFTKLDMEKEIRDVIQCLLRFTKDILPLKDILAELRSNGIILEEFQ